MLDYDAVDDWSPSLKVALNEVVDADAMKAVAVSRVEYIEDALELLLKCTEREAVIQRTLAWVRDNHIVGYHGSRLREEEAEAIRSHGLNVLNPELRGARLQRALSRHAAWDTKAGLLSDAIRSHSGSGRSGMREGQVHLTLSRAGLTGRFNHYLTHGSEFDQRVAWELLGEEGLALLERDGKPVLVQVSVPGQSALEAANPHFRVEGQLRRGEVPNLVREFLEAWSYRLVRPAFQTRTRLLDCGLMFKEPIPREWIMTVQDVDCTPT
jgi:hypothetical protein